MYCITLKINMLCIKTRRVPIENDTAEKIRSTIVRVTTGQLNEREKASARRSKGMLSQCKIKWIGITN